MAHLVDTSVLARLANTADPFHAVAAQAVLELHRRGEVLHLTPQNLVEFRNMATRPKAVNGLGLAAAAPVAVRVVRHLRLLSMAGTAGTILDRAVRSWEGSSFAFLYPVIAHPQPEQYELARRIAEEYPGYFDDKLVALLSSPKPVVVAQALTTLRWMKSPALADLPEWLLSDKRKVTIAGCLFVTQSLGEIARECAKEAKGRAEPGAAPDCGGR